MSFAFRLGAANRSQFPVYAILHKGVACVLTKDRALGRKEVPGRIRYVNVANGRLVDS